MYSYQTVSTYYNFSTVINIPMGKMTHISYNYMDEFAISGWYESKSMGMPIEEVTHMNNPSSPG